MKEFIKNLAHHTSGEALLERSRWYGPNLVTFLATGEETNGAFSLLKVTLCKGFEPPLHVHTREEESSLILEGEMIYEVGERTIHAKAGDFVHLPKSVPHTFKQVTDVVTLLLLITPAGFEELFKQFSRPALALELPPVPAEKPGPAFFETMTRLNAELGVTMLPNL